MNEEKLIFELYKDVCIGARKFRSIARKYNIPDEKITNLYAKINNYQIKKYGQRVSKGDFIEHRTKDEYQRIAINRRNARQQRLKKR